MGDRGITDALGVPARDLLGGLADAVIAADVSGTIVFANDAAAELLRAPAGDLIGLPLGTIVPERLRPQHHAGFARYIDTREPRVIGSRPVRLPALCRDGSEIEVELAISAHTNEQDQLVFVATLRDLSDRVELERQRDVARYLAASREVASRLTFGGDVRSFDEAAPLLLEVLGEQLGWDGGAAWAEKRDGLAPISVWSARTEELALEMTAGITFGPGEGLPGQVFASGEPMWIETVSESAMFIRRDRAVKVGVRSAFAFPVPVNGEATGVVEMYSLSPQPPAPELLAILQSAGQEIGRFLERAQSRRHLIEMAEALQASLLPPQPPAIPGLDIAVRYRAAAGEGQVGGDFYDVFPLPDGEWVVLIGDVSGRGPRAAALTALARYTLRAASVGAASPSAALRVLNDVVRREVESTIEGDDRFLTAAFLTIRPSAQGFRLEIACGGHPYPLARRLSGEVSEVPCQGELIGVFETHESRDEVVELGRGDLIVLVTDGVLEARRGAEQFGDDKLRSVIARSGAGTAAELADAIEAEVAQFATAGAADDLAIVVVRLPESPGTDTSLDVRAIDDELDQPLSVVT